MDYDNDGWKDIFVAQGHVMDTIEKTSPNLSYSSRRCCCATTRADSRESWPASLSEGVGRPRRGLRRSRQRRRHRHRRQQRRAGRPRAAERGRQRAAIGWRSGPSARSRTATGSGAGEGRVGVGPDAAVYGEDGSRLSVRQRQATDHRPWRRRERGAGRDRLAVRDRPDVQERAGWADADGRRANPDDHASSAPGAARCRGRRRRRIRAGDLVTRREGTAPR